MNIKERFKTIRGKNISAFTEVQIIIDKETGVNYLYVGRGYGGGVTPLIDADGKPVITRPKVGEEL